MAGVVTALRRSAGAQPPLSAARTALADAIAARATAAERLRTLRTVQERARAARHEADTALTFAREKAAEAAARAHEHNIAALMGNPPPDIPTRAQATAALQAAEDAAADAEAAARAIAQEIEALQTAQRQQADAIEEAAQGVLADEMRDTTAALIAEINTLHAHIVDRGMALDWLWKRNVVRLHHVTDSTPGANQARQSLAFPTDRAPTWGNANASPTAAKWQTAFDALHQDPTAEIPK